MMETSDVPAISPNLIIDSSCLDWKETLGAGGCGIVYRVIHEKWGPIGIKKLSTGFMTKYVK